MGVNNTGQQPDPLNGAKLTPQQLAAMQGIAQLRGAAVTPYSGSAPGGGEAGGVAQIVAALLAKRKQDQMRSLYGIPQPAQQAPGSMDSGTGVPGPQM